RDQSGGIDLSPSRRSESYQADIMQSGSGGWLSQTMQESASGLWHQQQQQPYQPESIYQPDSIYQYQEEFSTRPPTELGSAQLGDPLAYPQYQFSYLDTWQQSNCQQSCQELIYQQPNCQQQQQQQQPNCHQSYQSTCQSDLKALYNRQWECDLYSLTEQPLAEVSISDADCPVCQWDRQFTRTREPPDQLPAGPSTADWASASQHLPRIDGASKILVSFNSRLAAIYIEEAAGHRAGASAGAGGGANSGDERRARSSGSQVAGDVTSVGAAGSGVGGGMSIPASDALRTPGQLATSSRREEPADASFLASRTASSALPYRWQPPPPPPPQPPPAPPPAPPPPPPPAARSQEVVMTPMPQSSEPESTDSADATVSFAALDRQHRRRSSRLSDAVTKAATAAAAAAPERRQRDVTLQRTSELSSMLRTPSTGGTPRPWTSGSGTATTAAGAAAVTSTATSRVTSTTGGARIYGSEGSEGSEGVGVGVGGSGSGDRVPGKTTIQLLRFKTRDFVGPGKAPKRIEPPHFVSQQRPENVVSRGAAGDGFSRPRSPQTQLQKTNFSNSEVVDESSNLPPSDAADRQKQIMADAMRLARLIEASWGLL
ncbi:hypothetical protein BOX15_Mlig032184g1, partial [Macrostomum lignano]